jgi:hypothetical protein
MGRLRPNNIQGANKKVTWGVLGKRKTYVNQGFVEQPELTEEERRQQLLEKKKSWSYKPGRDIVVGMGGAAAPPPETFYLQTAQGDALQTAGGDNILWDI